MKKQTIFSIFIISLAAFLLVLIIGVEEPEVVEGEESLLIETRQKFFGEGNVDPATGDITKDKVILSWIGVSNFAAAINGHVILLNSWIPGGDKGDYVPATVKELISLQPEAIFIGHAHYDHSDNTAAISEQTGAIVVGTPEHCNKIKKDAANAEIITCLQAVGKDAKPGEMSQLDFLEGVRITVLSHIHSAVTVPDMQDKSHGFFPKKSFDSEAPMGDLKKLLGAIGEDEGGTLMYQFQVGEFTLTWNDSAGPIKEKEPGLIKVMENLPRTDVQVGAIVGFNQYFNGLRDPRIYMEALEPKLFVPTHHDNWAPPITTTAKNYKVNLQQELKLLAEEERPELLFLSDPEDYVNPQKLTFTVHEERWK